MKPNSKENNTRSNREEYHKDHQKNQGRPTKQIENQIENKFVTTNVLGYEPEQRKGDQDLKPESTTKPYQPVE